MSDNDNTAGEGIVRGDAGYATFRLEVTVNAPKDTVWKTFTDGIDDWWLPSFHMMGEGSTLNFDVRAGGQLVETQAGGGSLLWGTVQMVTPGSSIYLTGYSAPEWGGPHMTLLSFAFSEVDGATVVALTDSIVGRVDEANLASLREGWTELLENGLKKHVEAAA